MVQHNGSVWCKVVWFVHSFCKVIIVPRASTERERVGCPARNVVSEIAKPRIMPGTTLDAMRFVVRFILLHPFAQDQLHRAPNISIRLYWAKLLKRRIIFVLNAISKKRYLFTDRPSSRSSSTFGVDLLAKFAAFLAHCGP